LKGTLEVLIDRNTIREKVAELGKRISDDYEGKELILVGVLKGGFVFLSDLMREITIPLNVEFISVSSYGELKESTGVVRIIRILNEYYR
jgi:hypoxanthine phosphoribosyltransferase